MILMRYSLQIEHSLRLCFQPPLTVPWTLGSRAIKTVRPPHGAGLRAQQVPHRTDFAVAGRPKNVPAASARAATPLQPTSPKWLTVHRLGKLLTAVVQKWLDDSIFWSYPKIFLTNKSTPTFKLLTISHHAFPASNLNKNINKNTKNIAIFLINKNTPTFEVITISRHALLLTDF